MKIRFSRQVSFACRKTGYGSHIACFLCRSTRHLSGFAAGGREAAERRLRPHRRPALGHDQPESEQSHVKTPNIDRLGKEGVYFRNAFCTTSLCSPSRASILSGLYAHSHGVHNNFTEYPNDLPSFPRHLQAAGYTTATSASTTWAKRTTRSGRASTTSSRTRARASILTPSSTSMATRQSAAGLLHARRHRPGREVDSQRGRRR